MAIVATISQDGKRWIASIPVADIYTVRETARIMGQAVPVIYHYIKRGAMPAYLIDGVTHVKHKDLMAFVKRHRALRRSIDAKIKPTEGSDPSIRKDFDIPLDYVDS